MLALLFNPWMAIEFEPSRTSSLYGLRSITIGVSTTRLVTARPGGTTVGPAVPL